jgi:hypothetical protein
MLKEQKNKLTEKVTKIIKEIGHMSDIKKEVGQEFKARNLSTFRAMSVWMNPDYLFTLTDSNEDIQFLFLFSLALSKAMKNNKIDIELDVKSYFTPLEYNKWKEYKEDSQQDNIYPIIFENAQQISDKIWQTTLTAQQLSELSAQNIILYNFKTQRSPKVTVSGIKIDYDKQKTIEIKNRLLAGEQFPDHIKLNILNNYQEKIHYNPKTQTLTIGEGSIVNIFDGYHRKVANSLAIEENPDLDFTWPVIITNLTENAAKDYMVQIDKQKPIKKEQIKSWDLGKKENLVVSVIADDKISKLNKVMKEQYSEVKLKKGLVTKNIIAEAISENYRLNDTTDIRGLGKWIVEFTDYLFSLYPREFITDPYSIQEESVINHKNMFYGFIALSTYQEPDWKQKTKNKMESIDFNIDNPIWKEIGLFTNKPNKSVRNKIYKLFEEEEVR